MLIPRRDPHRDILHVEIILDAPPPSLAANSGVLHPAERRLRRGGHSVVDADNAEIKRFGYSEGPTEVTSPEIRSETDGRRVGSNPGKLLNGSSGNGTPGHLAGELFKQMAGVSIAHVPYKGGAQAMTDMMSGQVHLIFESTSSISPHHRAGRLRGIGVTGLKRVSAFPDLPTIAESGVPGYDVTVWAGLITPVGVSKAVIARLNDAVNKAMLSPSLLEKYAANGTEPVGGTAEAFGALIKSEVEKYAMIAKTLKAKVD